MRFALPQRVSLADVEDFATELAGALPEQVLSLNLDRVQRFELFAEARLLALMATARREQHVVEAHTRYQIDFETEKAKRLTKLFSDTIGGVVLGQMSHRVVAVGEDRRPAINRHQVDQAVARDGYFETGFERAAPIIDLFGGPPPAQLVRPHIDVEFEALFRSWVARMRLQTIGRVHLEALSTFAYEAFDNTRRHAVADLAGRPLEGMRFVLLRALNLDQTGAEQRAAEVDHQAVATYLGQLAGSIGRGGRFVELTIADSGPGIAATLTGSEAVHQGAWDQERKATESAFQLAVSRRANSPGAGRGLHKILRATEQMRGLIVVRSGRTELWRSFATRESSSAWSATERALLHGCSVSLLFPPLDSTQLSLTDDEK